jgi:hypothetical protein
VVRMAHMAGRCWGCIEPSAVAIMGSFSGY